MAERKRNIIKAVNTRPQQEVKEDKENQVSLDSQARLAEILNDSPRLVSLNGTEWEIRALRMGTQWLIAQKVIEIKKAEDKTFGDIINQFAVNIPAVLDVLTLALLNDKNKIYEDGDESKGFSKLYKATKDTLKWDCNVSELTNILLETLQLVQIDFFYQTLNVVDIFRVSVTERKITKKKTKVQK